MYLQESYKINFFLQESYMIHFFLQESYKIHFFFQESYKIHFFFQESYKIHFFFPESYRIHVFIFKILFLPPAPILMTYTKKKSITSQDMNVHIFWHRQIRAEEMKHQKNINLRHRKRVFWSLFFKYFPDFFINFLIF